MRKYVVFIYSDNSNELVYDLFNRQYDSLAGLRSSLPPNCLVYSLSEYVYMCNYNTDDLACIMRSNYVTFVDVKE